MGDKFHRRSDRDTSIAAAVKATGASSKCTFLVDKLMADGVGRNDYEIGVALRAPPYNYVKSVSTIRHGREALELIEILRDSGERRKKPESEGKGWTPMIVWVNSGTYVSSMRGIPERLPTRVSIRLTQTDATELVAAVEGTGEKHADLVLRVLRAFLLERQSRADSVKKGQP
jgi:hypothetical protein